MSKLKRTEIPMCPECGTALQNWECDGAYWRCPNDHHDRLYGDTYSDPDWGYYDHTAGEVIKMRARANYLSQKLGMCAIAEELHVWADRLEGKNG
jgi:hypothetical protein